MRGDPRLLKNSAVRISLFVQRTDGRLWERFWNGSYWVWDDTASHEQIRTILNQSGSTVVTEAGKPVGTFLNSEAAVLGSQVLGRAVPLVRGNTASTSNTDVRINLFVQSADRRLWERYWNGLRWKWDDTGKAVAGDPVAVVRGDVGSTDNAAVRINLFVRGADGMLWERFWGGSSWV
jgi:uncharacterized protein YegJ (DUF2314 family)